MRPIYHWGTQLWAYLHTVTIIDSDEPSVQIRESIKAIEILRNIPAIIPCHKCAVHYKEFFQTEIEGKGRFQRMELFDLLVEYHNQINRKLGKQVKTLEEARSFWTKTID
jgi:uncharacterized protein YllA (UPF0747 family)